MPPSPSFPARIGVSVWTAIILGVTVPWTDLVGHTHWGKVQWIPFISPPVTLFDVVGNVLLYVPFGYGLIRAFPPHMRGWHAAAIAGSLSLAVEWSQLYSHSRFPSVQDILCNVTGAWLSAAWADRRS